MQSLQVFIIDDDEEEIEIFQHLAKEFPFDINWTHADNGRKALKMLKTFHPDIIFLDVNMPGMNGIECLSEIRKIDDLKSIPVVINSNGVTATLREQATHLGAASCLKKSGNISKMKTALREILEINFMKRS